MDSFSTIERVLLPLGVVLVIAEAFVPSFGILGVLGIAAFTAGAVLLMDSPAQAISPWLIGSAAAFLGGLLLVVVRLALKGRKRPVVTGAEAIAGGQGEVVAWADGAGRVRLDGEIWLARGPLELSVGTSVAVIAREGLTLVVEPTHPLA